MKKIALMSLVASSVLMAGGWKIPETSTNAVALSAANIAHNSSADAAYYNPANMSFMKDESVMEMNLMYIGLDKINYKGAVGANQYDLNSKKESFIVPSIHYVSEKVGNARIGLSIVSPGGLSKRWDTGPARTSAQEFTLEIIEVNPTVAIPIGTKASFAFGFRLVHSSGVVKSNGTVPVMGPVTTELTRDMTGDSMDYGYNLALAYQPIPSVDISATYRSKIDLSIEGDATLISKTNMEIPGVVGSASYVGDGSVSVPLPAAAALAVSYTFESDTTLELVYERTFWSTYKNLDFSYGGALNDPILYSAFDAAIKKDWKDTDTYRFGFTQGISNFKIMAGMVYDESPVPNKTVSFELPDTDSFSVSLGGRYAIGKKWDIGMSALYSMREKKTITAADMNDNGLVGEFSDGNVLIISTGVSYKF